MIRFLKSLYIHVLLAIIAGVLLGYFYPGTAVQLKSLGDAFICLIKMMIAPIAQVLDAVWEFAAVSARPRMKIRNETYF